MLIIAQNLPLRRLSPDAWDKIEIDLRAIFERVGGISVRSLKPGLAEFELVGSNERAVGAKLDRLAKELPGWRFSKSGTYSLPDPLNLQVLN